MNSHSSADGSNSATEHERRNRPAAPGTSDDTPPAWWIYQGTGRPVDDAGLAGRLPPAPPWREFGGGPPFQPPPPQDEAELTRRLGPVVNLGTARRGDPREADAVNAAIYLRRPLLVTGPPGAGKSTLAYKISRELRLGRVLRWPIRSRTTVRMGLYEYDAIARAQDAAALSHGLSHGDEQEPQVGDYLQLGPLGTALLPYELPRVLLIDELDKGDGDLPNDLLDILEEGEYTIPELLRLRARRPRVRVHTADPDVTAFIEGGVVRCRAFPIVIITSNGEREFPAAFLRRCLRFECDEPDEDRLADMVVAHFARRGAADLELLRRFVHERRARQGLAADQFLNAVFLASSGANATGDEWNRLLDLVWQRLSVTAVPE